jgi:4-amino-4-deoxy-L-arabinose transferase-like glycosyltransferase
MNKDMNDVNTSLEEDWSGKPGGRSAGWVFWLSLLCLALAIAIPRRLGLNRPVTPDEHLWLARSANFFMALARGDLARTYQSEHPGVTVMWAGAAGFLTRYPQYRASGPDQADSNEFNRYIRNAKGVSPLEILVAGRFFMVLGHTLILLLCFWYACRLIGTVPALISFLLVAFEPYHIALTRLLHLDGMLGNLMLLSLLAFIYYVERRGAWDLVVSAIAAGLGLLTKQPAVLMAPVVGLLTAYACWKNRGTQGDRLSSWLVKPGFWILGSWGLIMVLTVIALWPAMWVRPVQTISAIVTQGAGHFETDSDLPRYFNGRIIPSRDFGIQYWYFYPASYLYRSTPLVLAGLALAAWAFLKKRSPLDSSRGRSILLGLLLFVAVFTLFLGAGDKKFDRYLAPVYAPLDIVAGLGWSSLLLAFKKKSAHRILRYAPYAAALLVVALQAVLALKTAPYYLAYYNPMLGGAQQAANVLPIGWGEGLDLAAQYLNKKPNVGKLEVVAYYASGCFSYYFEGRTRETTFATDLTESDWQKFIESDYAVIYISQQQRKIGSAILDYVSHLKPEHSVWINGLEYARIYKLHPE